MGGHLSLLTMADLLSPSDDYDFDAAASAFPDLDALGDSDIPSSATPMPAPKPGAVGAPPVVNFAFDDPAPPPVKVTGDDEIAQFESSFPDIGVPVRLLLVLRVATKYF